MEDQLLLFGASVLSVCVAASVDVIIAAVSDGDDALASRVSYVPRPPSMTYPGIVAGAAFMAIMVQTGVAPLSAAAAFLVPWVLAQLIVAEFYGVAPRRRLKRAALAAACGGLGVLVSGA